MHALASCVHLLHVFSSFSVGGPQVRFARFADALADKYRHSIISLDDDTDCAALLGRNLNVRFSTIKVNKGRGIDIANLVRFRRRLSAMRPDLLLTYNWGAIEWAVVNRWPPITPHIHFEDGFGPEEASGKQLLRRVLFRRFALRPRTVLVVPSRTLERIATEDWHIDPRRVIYIPNGVDCTKFTPRNHVDWSAESITQINGPKVGAVGLLRPEKNLTRLIRCVATMQNSPSLRLVIVGDGPERATLVAAARNFGISHRVTFTGLVERPEEILRSFDIFALSSDTEQMPFSIIEAMAAGLPIVATNVGDLRWMVSEENLPFLVARENEAGFATALARLAGDAALRRRIGAANREKAKRDYDLRTMCNAYDAIFTAIAAGPRGRKADKASAILDLGMLVRKSSEEAANQELAAKSKSLDR